MLLLIVMGCNEHAAPSAPIVFPDEIVNWAEWQFAKTDDDPFSEHQPDTIDCSPAAMQMEGEQLEIQTDFCNYAFLKWEANQPVDTDTTLAFLMLHSGLWAPEAALAHAALLHEKNILWEEQFPIPSSGDFFYSEITLEQPISQGDLIRLHLHNHGPNDWKLGYLKPLNP